MTVLAAHRWHTNGHMIADVAQLGYLDGRVFDATYGQGAFWKIWRPENLVTNDLHTDADHHYDFRMFPREWQSFFDAVVFDPPYKLNGTSRPQDFATDNPYGVAGPYVSAKARDALMVDGLIQCSWVTRRYLLVKCQDQVCSGHMHWQTVMMIDAARTWSMELVDRFDLLGKHRPQPMEGRQQKHAHGRPSTLLVFRKDRA